MSIDGIDAISLARCSPAGFGALADGSKFAYPPHLRLINAALMDATFGTGAKRVAIFMPPRHGKSWFASRIYPAWAMGRVAGIRFLLASYEAEFAATWGERSRILFESHGAEVFGARLDVFRKARNAWRTTDGSEMVTTGVGGSLTGRGADVLLIDDPVKNAEQAASEVYRRKTWEWYQSTAYTRLEPNGRVILIMTRWHEDDLAGRILKESGEEWQVLNLPALAEEGDPLGRAEGEPLWAARYDAARLGEIRDTLGSYYWNALYQQHPAPLSGALFRREQFAYFESRFENGKEFVVVHRNGGASEVFDASMLTKFSTCDPAASERSSADPFVLTTFYVTPTYDLLVDDVVRMRVEGAKQPAIIESVYRERRPEIIGIETNAMGLTLYQNVRDRGIPVLELKAERDKVTRALGIAARFESGKVFFRQGAPWLPDLESELLTFPYGSHDDQTDTLSYGAVLLARIMENSNVETVTLDDRVSISPY